MSIQPFSSGYNQVQPVVLFKNLLQGGEWDESRSVLVVALVVIDACHLIVCIASLDILTYRLAILEQKFSRLLVQHNDLSLLTDVEWVDEPAFYDFQCHNVIVVGMYPIQTDI